MKIVLDTSILVRANESVQGLARDLLLTIVRSDHTLVLSNEILHELAKVLRYPRLWAFYGLTEDSVFNYISLLRQSCEMVTLNPLLVAPIRDVNDLIVMQTALLGGSA